MSNKYDGASSTTLSPEADIRSRQSRMPESRSVPNKKMVVIGLYGVPGSGKTFLLEQLRKELGNEHFAFYEGSDMIATVTPGGLEAFHRLNKQERTSSRRLAIGAIGGKCAESGQTAIVAGHFMFWPEGDGAGQLVYTQNDMNTFTHILYLDVPAGLVVDRRLHDAERDRPSTSEIHLWEWQQTEKAKLRHLCRQHGILFSVVSPHPNLPSKVATLIRDFRQNIEEHNLFRAEHMLDSILATTKSRLETMLVMDADRTLAAEDTGTLFWKVVFDSWWRKIEEFPLKTLFSSPLGYSYTAFRQATLLYEETADDQEFEALCLDVASKVSMHPEIISLLHRVARQEHVGAIVVTCSLRRVWDMVLEREGLSETVKVIGGGRVSDGYVVTAGVKAALVTRLRQTYNAYVWAFGDSPLDLEMLSEADQAIVVVGDEQIRSKTMDAALRKAIGDDGLQARQVVLPSAASPRLDKAELPVICLTDREFVNSVLRPRRSQHASIQVSHATHKNAAKLLMTSMRDATFAGPVLREVHRWVGWYLGTEFLADIMDFEEYAIPHVQGYHTIGHRLLHERQTLIVALMRGGEAMAFGVNDAFPLAMFLHAKRPDDITLHHLNATTNIVLVDSVLNSGETVIEFVRHVRNLRADLRIVVVIGVIQAQSISSEGSLTQALGGYAKLDFIALRLSGNRYTGSGTTDTGNRLFNTTHLT